jgi:hypothetical protein
MKEKSFNYRKNTGEIKSYKIFVLEEHEDYIMGLLEAGISDEGKKMLREKESVTVEDLKPLGVGLLRRFTRSHIIN